MVTEYMMNISDKNNLKKYYMPFIKNGGMFIPTNDICDLNTKISLQLILPENPDVYQVNGRVVWINPEFAQQGREQGIGIQFDQEHSPVLNNKIEALFKGINSETNQSATM